MENQEHEVKDPAQLDLFKDNDLTPIITKYNIKKITTFEELEKYFDLEKLDEDNTPLIVCKHKVCIIFDNEIFNETYLLDVIAEYLDKHLDIIKSVEIIYIDSYEVRGKLFAKDDFEDCEDHELFLKDAEKRNFEKEYLHPGILTINPTINQISVFSEKMAPITLEQVQAIFIQSGLEV